MYDFPWKKHLQEHDDHPPIDPLLEPLSVWGVLKSDPQNHSFHIKIIELLDDWGIHMNLPRETHASPHIFHPLAARAPSEPSPNADVAPEQCW